MSLFQCDLIVTINSVNISIESIRATAVKYCYSIILLYWQCIYIIHISLTWCYGGYAGSSCLPSIFCCRVNDVTPLRSYLQDWGHFLNLSMRYHRRLGAWGGGAMEANEEVTMQIVYPMWSGHVYHLYQCVLCQDLFLQCLPRGY